MSALVGPATAAPVAELQRPGIDGRKGDLIDRLACLLQRSRLWARRERRRFAAARASGDTCAVHAARARYRRAVTWRSRLYREYVDAVFAAYA